MPKLAILILTYNEEKNIADCIRSADFADEIVIVDSGSTDKTQEIAESLGAKIFTHPMENFAAQRNYALTVTDADWVFYLDADERLTTEAAKEIMAAVKTNEPAAYAIKRINYLFKRRQMHGAHKPDWPLRLYPRRAVKWSGAVHESAEVSVPKKRLQSSMHHYTYNDWDTYFAKANKYTSLAAKEMRERGKKASLIDITIHPVFAFFRAYILKAGFLDGAFGFVFSVLHAQYVFNKYIKLRYKSVD